MIGNSGHGFDHICTEDPSHGMWHPTESHVGAQCENFVKGTRCVGRLKAVGAGSTRLNAEASVTT